MESLKFRMALPSVFPSSGSRLGPKMSSTMPRIRRCSPEIPNIVWVYLLALGFSSAVLTSRVCADEIHPSGNNAFQTVTGDDNEDDRQHWDRLYNTQSYVYGTQPASFLRDHLKLLTQGKVLDIA